jgi:hypothetical protein
MEYKLILSSFAPSFVVQVNDALLDGWKLYGNPFTQHDMICQALTKTTKEFDDKQLLM